MVIIDTAGRLSVDKEMMDEIGNIKDAVRPNEILFVVDSMTGQDAVNTAKAFNDKLNFDGVIYQIRRRYTRRSCINHSFRSRKTH